MCESWQCHPPVDNKSEVSTDWDLQCGISH